MLVYGGHFTQAMTRAILAAAEKKMKAVDENAAVRRKVFNVMVESLQNMVRHGCADDRLHNADGVFLLARDIERYTIMSGNTIRKSGIAHLKDALESINLLDPQGLRARYKENIRNTPLSEKGGARLGFIDMARRSDDKLWFEFRDVSTTDAFFCLRVNVSRAFNT